MFPKNLEENDKKPVATLNNSFKTIRDVNYISKC